MATKSSIHIKPCNIASSEAHNRRTAEYMRHIGESRIYVVPELSTDNEQWINPDFGSPDLRMHYDNIRQMVKEKTGRAMQEKERERKGKNGKIVKIAGCSPIREGVLLVRSDTTLADVRKFGEECQRRWGITPLQIFLHKDEGHWLNGQPEAEDRESFKVGDRWFKPNYHAHIVFDWMNHETGKSRKLNDDDMMQMQTLASDILLMERGQSKAVTGKEHLERNDFIIEKQKAELQRMDAAKRHKEEQINLAEQELQTIADISLFKGRITLTPEVYWNTTRDLLYKCQIPTTTGYSQQWQNVGRVSNKGFELSINGDILRGKDYVLSANFNMGMNKTKVEKINGTDAYIPGKSWDSEDNFRLVEGKEVGLIYGYVFEGLYGFNEFHRNGFSYAANDEAYLAENPGVQEKPTVTGLFGTAPGRIKLKDINGDGKIDINDRTVVGNTNPKVQGGFGLSGKWKNFDFTANFTYMLDFDVINATAYQLSSAKGASQINPRNVLKKFDYNNRWVYHGDIYIENAAQRQHLQPQRTARAPRRHLYRGSTQRPLHRRWQEVGSEVIHRLNSLISNKHEKAIYKAHSR